jgi:hypothetical protein
MDYGAKTSLPGYDVKNCADRFLVYSSAFLNLKVLASYSVSGVVPPNGDGTFTVNSGTDVFTSAAHGLSNGDMINFDTDGTLPGGLSTFIEEVDTFIFEPYGLIYYVINVTTNTFQVSLTAGGSAVDITSTGSGTHYWYTDVNKIVITHNLSYLSPWIFSYNGIDSSGGTSSFMADSFEQLTIRIYPNTTEIYIRQGFDDLSPGQTVYFTCYQFLDTFDSYTAPNIDTGTTSGASSDDYGIRISKDGFDVKNCDDVDCVLSSSFFSNIIHTKGNNSGSSITHDLGYLPSFLAYSKPEAKTFLVLANDKVGISTTGLSWSLYPNDVSYYVIFKNKSV